jgi:hypothetical protein
MFEAFGATTPKGAQGLPAPQRTETQRAIDAQRGLDLPDPSAPPTDLEERARALFEAAATAPTRALPPSTPAQGARSDLDLATGPEGGFVLPFGWVTFLVLQLGLFAVAFGLGSLTAGGRAAAAEGDADLGLAQVGPESPGNVLGNLSGSRETERSTRRTDQSGVRGSQPTAGAGDSDRPSTGAATDDPYLAAFLDPQNHFSLQVASYDGSPNGQSMARHWQGYLRERGFSTVLRQVGTGLALFVGASPNLLAIEELEARVRELRDERGTRIFTAPRVVNLSGYR